MDCSAGFDGLTVAELEVSLRTILQGKVVGDFSLAVLGALPLGEREPIEVMGRVRQLGHLTCIEPSLLELLFTSRETPLAQVSQAKIMLPTKGKRYDHRQAAAQVKESDALVD